MRRGRCEMGYRKILVQVIGDEGDAHVVRASLALAKTFDSHVIALYVQTDPADVVRNINADLPSRVIQELIDAARSAAEADLSSIRGMLRHLEAELQYPSSRLSLRVRNGREEEEVLAESLLSDLIVFEHPAELKGGTKRATVEDVVLASGRPVLLLPRGRAAALVGGRAVIGWDGGAAASHAVSLALPLLERASSIEALSIADDVANSERARELREYLKLSGLRCVDRAINPAFEETGAVLLDAARRADADILVVGGYGHARLREVVFGGVTRHLLTHPALPVFIAH